MKKILGILMSVLMTFALIMPISADNNEIVVTNGFTFTSETTQEQINEWASGAATIEEVDGTYLVTLQNNITLKKGATNPIVFRDFDSGKEQPTMILDLNGFTVLGKITVIANYGNLVIKDSEGTGKVIYDGGQYMPTVQNSGYSLTIEGGTFECQGANSASYNAAISSAANTETVINGGTFEGNGAGTLMTYGNVTINGGEFNGAYGVVSKVSSDGVEGNIVFSEDSSAVINADKIAFVVQGKEDKSGSIDVKGGTFNAPTVAGKLGDAVATDKVSIENGNFTANPSEFVKSEENVVVDYKTPSEENKSFVVGTNVKINELLNNLPANSEVNVLKGDADLDVKNDITVKNGTDRDIIINGNPLKPNEEVKPNEEENTPNTDNDRPIYHPSYNDKEDKEEVKEYTTEEKSAACVELLGKGWEYSEKNKSCVYTLDQESQQIPNTSTR